MPKTQREQTTNTYNGIRTTIVILSNVDARKNRKKSKEI